MRKKVPADDRQFGVIAGSGMAGVVDAFEVAQRVAFEDIDGVGAATVAGHRGEVCRCRADGRGLLIALGRRHRYEGEARAAYRLVEWLSESGVTDLVVASAAGGLRSFHEPGEMVVARGIVDLQQRERAAPPRPPQGARGMGCIASARARALRGRLRTDLGLTRELEAAAARAGVAVGRGVLACLDGPTYETHAEVRFLRRIGADVVTMSSAPEIEAANTLGLPVASILLITNRATGVGASVPGHDEVVEEAARGSRRIAGLILELINSQ